MVFDSARAMPDSVPDGARPVARVLLIGPGQRLLLLHAEHASTGQRFWLTPGGGLEPSETFEEAARRELHEETGLHVEDIGPWVWTRRHRYPWAGRMCDQYERFFVATTREDTVAPLKRDTYVIGHQWWSLPDLRASAAHFAPQKLVDLSEALFRGEYPSSPIDCGL